MGLSLVQTLNLIDPLSFEYHLNYESKSYEPTVVPERSNLVLATLEDLDVYQDGHGLNGEVTDSSQRAISEAWFWKAQDLRQIRALMNDELTSGTLAANGIVVDASVAEKLGLHLRSRIVVQYLDAFTVKNCEASVVGITRTYRNIKRQGAPGLIVANTDICKAISASSSASSQTVTYSFSQKYEFDKAFQPKNEFLSDIWDSNSSTSNQSLFMVLYCTSLGFWVFAVNRVHTGLAASTASLRWAILRLGGSRKKIKFAYKCVTAGLSLITIPPALVLAIEVLNYGPHFAIGNDNILFVVSIQIVITMIAIAFFDKSINRFRSEMKRDA